MFRFESTGILYFLFLIPIIIGIYILHRRKRMRNLKKFGNPILLASLNPQTSNLKPVFKLILILLGLTFLILGLANPQKGSKLSEGKREGIDVILLLDISNSMTAEDIKPNRLERAKQIISRMIDNFSNDRIAIILFAGDAFIQLPLTSDYSAAKLFLSVVETDMIPVQGTAIGRAIDLAVNQMITEDKVKKSIIIITDGENHEDDAVGMAADAYKKGFIVNTIGMGSVNGGPIPVKSNGSNIGFMKDRDGGIVTTRLNPEMLQKIAVSGGGEFIQTGESDPNLTKLIDKLAGLQKTEYQSKIFVDYEDRFQYFIAAALFFMIIEIIFSDRRNKIIQSLNKFVESSNIKNK